MSKSKVSCCCCGKMIFPQKSNAIYKKYGIYYYCKNKNCQERFIEDAGDIPDE